MKLPEKYNLYKHNDYSEDLKIETDFYCGHLPENGCAPKEVATRNMMHLKRIAAILEHLMLVNEEVVKLGERDDNRIS